MFSKKNEGGRSANCETGKQKTDTVSRPTGKTARKAPIWSFRQDRGNAPNSDRIVFLPHRKKTGLRQGKKTGRQAMSGSVWCWYCLVANSLLFFAAQVLLADGGGEPPRMSWIVEENPVPLIWYRENQTNELKYVVGVVLEKPAAEGKPGCTNTERNGGEPPFFPAVSAGRVNAALRWAGGGPVSAPPRASHRLERSGRRPGGLFDRDRDRAASDRGGILAKRRSDGPGLLSRRRDGSKGVLSRLCRSGSCGGRREP